ncbi:MAG: acyl-CoA dehydrogenase family protein [Myxococcota bacterium]
MTRPSDPSAPLAFAAPETDPAGRARELAPFLRARADEIEAARKLPADVHRALASAGFYRSWAPRECGGLELAVWPVAESFEALARADGSAAWCAFIAATSATALATLPEATARAVFAPAERALISGVFAATGTAEREGDAFRVNGRWAFGSGIQNADWVLAGCRLLENGAPMTRGGGAPRTHMVLVPAREVEFLDTWHVSGLSGTGSTDFALHDVRVPAERVVGFAREHPPDRPLYRFPNFTLLALGIGMVGLGLGRAALDELALLASAKKPMGSSRTLAERALAQSAVAEAEAELRSARAFLREAVEAAWDRACEHEPIAPELRRDLRLATTHAARNAAHVAARMYELGGASSIYKRSPLQRIFRDAHVATQHGMVAPATLELAGRMFLGLPTDTGSL